MSSRAHRPLGEKAATNFGRWKDQVTDTALGKLLGSNEPAVTKTATAELQRIVADQVPYSPIYNSYWFIAINASHWTGWPTPERFSHVPFPGLGPDATLTLMGLKQAAK